MEWVNEFQQEEKKLLKQSKKQQHDPKTEMFKKKIIPELKNENTTSVSLWREQENA